MALEAFRASLPRRGAKGRDDRLFLEALHYFSVHNISWRALPERFGNWRREIDPSRHPLRSNRARQGQDRHWRAVGHFQKRIEARPEKLWPAEPPPASEAS